MSEPRFSDMSDNEFDAYRPRNEEEEWEYQVEAEFREWCKRNKEDPKSCEARETYDRFQVQQWWDNLAPDDREGYEHMMLKDD